MINSQSFILLAQLICIFFLLHLFRYWTSSMFSIPLTPPLWYSKHSQIADTRSCWSHDQSISLLRSDPQLCPVSSPRRIVCASIQILLTQVSTFHSHQPPPSSNKRQSPHQPFTSDPYLIFSLTHISRYDNISSLATQWRLRRIKRISADGYNVSFSG